jgi:hypothetical protein
VRLPARGFAVIIGLLAVGCHPRDRKTMEIVRHELAVLQPPAGMHPSEPQVGLGEMYAEGTQTYCLPDEKTGQVALDTMMRNGGWKPFTTETTAQGTLWHYRKDARFGILLLETVPQSCGRRFQVQVVEAL